MNEMNDMSMSARGASRDDASWKFTFVNSIAPPPVRTRACTHGWRRLSSQRNNNTERTKEQAQESSSQACRSTSGEDGVSQQCGATGFVGKPLHEVLQDAQVQDAVADALHE